MEINELAKQLIDKYTNNTKTVKTTNNKQPVANNNVSSQSRPYTNTEMKIFEIADQTLEILEHQLMSAIEQEEYCAFIYDSVHATRTGKYNMCYRIEKILNKYANKWKTNKVMEEEKKDPSPIAPIKPINTLK